jgi:hypothetical protein
MTLQRRWIWQAFVLIAVYYCSLSEVASTTTITNEDCVDDKPKLCQARPHEDCDTDPSWMMIHCRNTCQVCHFYTFPQDAGFGKLPEHLSIQVLKVARRTNLYYDAIVQNSSNPSSGALTRSHCYDQDSKCAFWTFQGQCENFEFQSFMDRNCPLSCHYCDKDLWKGRAFLQFVLDTLANEYHAQPNVIDSRLRTLELILTTVGMDPAILDQPVQEQGDNNNNNWLEELHRRFVALIPQALWQIYESPTGPITDKDYQILQGLFQGVVADDDDDRSAFLSQILIPYRSRGAIVSVLQDMDTLVMRSMDLTVGFSIPNDAAIQAIGEAGKIVQMGAGTGYWAGLLQHAGVDILAYDLHPPGVVGEEENVFFERPYTNNILQGSCTDVFEQHEYLAKERTLLTIWPNDPDPVDNRQFCQGDCHGSQAVWDADCLLAYLKAGGQRVVYVGERENTLAAGDHGDCGMSSTRHFQSLLAQHFTLVKTVSIPTWWLNQDDLTIWERRFKREGKEKNYEL